MTGQPLSIMASRRAVTLFWDRTAEHELDLDFDQALDVLSSLSVAIRMLAYASGMSPKDFTKRALKAQERADKDVLRAMRQHHREHHK